MVRAIALYITLLALAGCATLTTLAGNPIVQTGVKYGIIRLLSDHPDKQPQALAVIKEVRRYSTQEADATIDDLAQRAMEAVPWSRMNLADQIVAQDMILYASNYLKDMVGDGVLEPDQKVAVRDFLLWIENAVKLVGT